MKKGIIYFLPTYLIVCLADIGLINYAVTFVLSFFFIVLSYKSFKTEHDSFCSLLYLMNLSIPISFRSIVGSTFAELPLPWFYILGLVFFIKSLHKMQTNNTDFSVLMLFTFAIGLFPLLIASDYLEAFKEFTTYSFFLIMCFATNNIKIQYRERLQSDFVDTYIVGCIFSALGLLLQYFFILRGEELFRVEYFANDRIYLSFLFYDMSSMTLYMVTGCMMLLVREDGNKVINMMLLGLILYGTSVSSARTGVVAFGIVSAFFFILSKKNTASQKVIMLFVLSIVFIGALKLLGQVRDLSSGSSALVDDNGRFKTYESGINAFLENPLFGKGYDLSSWLVERGLMVPHSAIINILGQTGIIYTSLILVTLYYIYHRANLLRDSTIMWVIILSYFGSFLVPGFFSTRFFTVIAMFTVLRANSTSIIIKNRFR